MGSTAASIEDHKNRHIELHKYLDELVADWIFQTGMLPSQGTVLDLMGWSYQQTLNTTEKEA